MWYSIGSRFLGVVFGVLFVSNVTLAQVPHEFTRGMAFDILHYDVDLNTTFPNDTLVGSAAIQLTTHGLSTPVSHIIFDLLDMTIDSVYTSNGATTFTYSNDSLLDVSLGSFSEGDTITVYVDYHGKPFHEQWGGWHNQGGVQFNLGVGFQSIPHNLGKAWHPCFDNFIERATYTVSLTTDGGNVGVGSGVLVNEKVLSGDTIKRTWQLNQPIPTYLYGIAIADFVELKDTILSLQQSVPAQYFAKRSDTSRMRALMKPVAEAMRIYSQSFGPYHWDRVGYVATPLGAMEHATNIAIPLHAPHTTVAHELAHHWWGNLITCETDHDMWINEGMAVFSEYLFLEKYESLHSRNETMADQLYEVLKRAHLEDGGYQPLSGIPREHTYSTLHTYYRGGLIAHNLRQYMGDSAFFKGVSDLLDDWKFKAVGSYVMEDYLQAYANFYMKFFFDEWVYQPGMPDFHIASVTSTSTGGSYETTVDIEQLLVGANKYFGNAPLTIAYYSATGEEVLRKVRSQGESFTVKETLPFKPEIVRINPYQELNYAMTQNTDTLFSRGFVASSRTDLNVQAAHITDSARVFTECHWVTAPIALKNMKDLGVSISSNRFWRFEGFTHPEDSFSARVSYDARQGYFDYGTIDDAEDSLVMLYRRQPSEAWEVYDKCIHIVGSPTDSLGFFQITRLEKGEYAIGSYSEWVHELSVQPRVEEPKKVRIYPNPSSGRFVADMRDVDFSENSIFQILDQHGREVANIKVRGEEIEVNLSEYQNGVYFYRLRDEGVTLDAGRIIRK